MKKIYLLIPVFAILLTACTKTDYISPRSDADEWMRTHDHGLVAYVDYPSGNYIVETSYGYSVVELYSGNGPIENDHEYAYFDSRGTQTIYNRSGNFFTQG